MVRGTRSLMLRSASIMLGKTAAITKDFEIVEE